MTLALFLGLMLILSTLTSQLTELAKTKLKDSNRDYSANLLVLLISFVVGIAGTIAVYIIFEIPFSQHNICCIVIMWIMVWLCSMLGYDKVVQLIDQIMRLKGSD